MRNSLRSRIRGTAIFMALLMIAIVAGMASVLMRMQYIDIRRTQMMLTSEQSYLYAQGVIDWAKGALKTDFQNPGGTLWPMVLPPTPIADGAGAISGTLQDAQGLLNINAYSTTSNGQTSQQAPGVVIPGGQTAQQPGNGVNPYQKTTQAASANQAVGANQGGGANQANSAYMFNLLGLLGMQINQQGQQQLVSAITAWVSRPPGSINNTDSYDQQYGRLSPPYRSPHNLMASVSELRTVWGVTPAMYSQLLPYIVALPQDAGFNPAHAPPLLQKAAGFNGQGGQAGQYFLLRADVYLNDQHLVLYTLLQRNNDPQKFYVAQLWQSFGTE